MKRFTLVFLSACAFFLVGLFSWSFGYTSGWYDRAEKSESKYEFVSRLANAPISQASITEICLLTEYVLDIGNFGGEIAHLLKGNLLTDCPPTPEKLIELRRAQVCPYIINANIAELNKKDADKTDIAYSFLGEEWRCSMTPEQFKQIAAKIMPPISPEMQKFLDKPTSGPVTPEAILHQTSQP